MALLLAEETEDTGRGENAPIDLSSIFLLADSDRLLAEDFKKSDN